MKKLLIVALAALCALGVFFSTGPDAAAKKSDWQLVELFPGSAKQPPQPLYFDIGAAYAPDMTTDIHGNLYVMDGEKIVRFTPEGKLDTGWGKKGRCYLNLRKLNCECTGIVADSRGYIYATCMVCEDGGDIFLERFTPKGELDKSWFKDGINRGYNSNDEAEQQAPFYNGDIAVDRRDYLYLYDGDEVYRLTPNGKKDSDWKGIKQGRAEDARPLLDYMTMAGRDELYLFSVEGGYIEKCDINGKLDARIENAPDIFEAINSCGEIEVGPDGSFYIIDEGGITVKRHSSDGKPDKAWCGNGVFMVSETNSMESPVSLLTLDAEGSMYVADELGEIRKYSADGKLDTSWGKSGALGNVDVSDGIYHQIAGIASDGLGNLYIADCPSGYEKTLLYRFDSRLKTDKNWSKNASQYSNYNDFMDIVVDEEGRLYKHTADETFRLKPDGTKDDTWTMCIEGDWDIVFAKNGYTYWVSFYGTAKRYDLSGKKDVSWGKNGSLYVSNANIAFDNSGYFYTGCPFDVNINKYTPQGNPDATWCDKGSKLISIENFGMGTMALDGGGNLYVIDEFNDRLLRYEDDGSLDTSWCDNGAIRLPADANEESGNGRYMFTDQDVMILEGRIYLLCNNRLYVLDDELARVDTASAAAEAAKSENGVWWIVALVVVTAGGVLTESRRAKR